MITKKLRVTNDNKMNPNRTRYPYVTEHFEVKAQMTLRLSLGHG